MRAVRIDEIEIPKDATLESLVTEFFPEIHGKLVPKAAGEGHFVVHLRFEGGPSFTLTFRGASATVAEGEVGTADFWVSADDATARTFVDDARGPRRWAMKYAPAGDIQSISDPRMLKRFALVDGRIELALTDFPGGRARLTLGTGRAAKKGIDTFEPDVTIEASTDVFERVLSGALAPDAALSDGGVKLSGKRVLAMQYAFGMAPLAPALPNSGPKR